MSVFRYSKYKVRIDPDSQKTQGLHVGDIVRRQYAGRERVVYSLMCVTETGTELVGDKEAPYFISSIVLFPFALKQRHCRGQPSHLTALYRAFSLTYPDAVFTFLVPILRILCPIGQMQKSCSSL